MDPSRVRAPEVRVAGRRRKALWLGLGLLLLGGAAWWLWPDPPPPRVAEAPRKRHVSTKPAWAHPAPPIPTPRTRAAAPEPDEDPPLAEPAEVDSAAPEILATTLKIHASYPDGEPVRDPIFAVSRDCHIWRGTPQGPDLVVQTIEPRCTVRVGRPDGRLFAWSDEVDLDLSGGQTDVDVVLPREETGGLGVAFQPAEDGMEVSRVWPGSPADQLGLSEGDVILEVDGLPTDALTEDEFIDVMTGPVGTDVKFVVGYDADTGWVEEELTLTRARID